MQIYYTVHTKDILTKLFLLLFSLFYFFFASQAQLLAIQQKA